MPFSGKKGGQLFSTSFAPFIRGKSENLLFFGHLLMVGVRGVLDWLMPWSTLSKIILSFASLLMRLDISNYNRIMISFVWITIGLEKKENVQGGKNGTPCIVDQGLYFHYVLKFKVAYMWTSGQLDCQLSQLINFTRNLHVKMSSKS